MNKTATLLGIIGAIALTAAVLLTFTNLASANPSQTIRNNTSSATTLASSVATSSQVAWQTAGTATTTIVLNSNIGGDTIADSGVLILYRLAAGGTTKTKIDLEYSMDCDATSPDWYGVATTSIGTTVTTGNAGLTWQFASSTRGGISRPLNTDTIAIPITFPTRCVRAVLTVPVGSASSSIYGEFIAKKQLR